MPASAAFAKLNLKDHKEIAVLNMPESFKADVAKLDGVKVRTTLSGGDAIGFVLAFATRQAEIAPLAKAIAEAAPGDAVVWFAYPKGSSKRYQSDLSRDSGWSATLGALGFEGVRMVAIDEDWSAVRFRRAEFIKTMKRDPKHAMSKVGKEKTAKKTAV